MSLFESARLVEVRGHYFGRGFVRRSIVDGFKLLARFALPYFLDGIEFGGGGRICQLNFELAVAVVPQHARFDFFDFLLALRRLDALVNRGQNTRACHYDF